MSEAKQKEETKKDIKEISIADECYNKYKETNYNINDFYTLFKYLKSDDPLIQFKGLVGMRKLCQEEEKKEESKKLFNVLINYLIEFIKDYPEEFQYESLVCLKNIEKINLKVDQIIKVKKDSEIIDIAFSKIKDAKNLKIKAVTLASYFSYVSTLINDEIILKKMISEQLIEDIINAIKNFMNEPIIIKYSLKICDNILKNRDHHNWETELLDLMAKQNKKPEDIIQLLPNIINKYPNELKILKYCLIIIEEFTHSVKSEYLNDIIQLNLMEKIIQLIDTEDGNIIYYSLRIIGNFSINEDSIFTQHIIDLNALDVLKKTLRKEYNEKNENIRIESSFIISNIAAGTQDQLIKLYENNFFDILAEIIQNENENSVKKNCLWAIYNFSLIKNPEYLEKLVEKGFMKIIVDRFNYDNGEVLVGSIEALENLLEFGKKIRNAGANNIIDSEINNLDLLNAIKNLKKNNLEELCQKKTHYLLTRYFNIDDANNI